MKIVQFEDYNLISHLPEAWSSSPLLKKFSNIPLLILFHFRMESEQVCACQMTPPLWWHIVYLENGQWSFLGIEVISVPYKRILQLTDENLKKQTGLRDTPRWNFFPSCANLQLVSLLKWWMVSWENVRFFVFWNHGSLFIWTLAREASICWLCATPSYAHKQTDL